MPPIRIEVAEETNARLLFYKQEAAKIAVERLNACAHRHEIEIRADVVQLDFAKSFLQSDMRIEARRAFAHIHIDDAEFLHREIIQADHRRDANAPIHRTERRIAVK